VGLHSNFHISAVGLDISLAHVTSKLNRCPLQQQRVAFAPVVSASTPRQAGRSLSQAFHHLLVSFNKLLELKSSHTQGQGSQHG
jgi:hypothetical protein